MKNIITILFLGIFLFSFGQAEEEISDIEIAESQIIQLKENGALVVRLHLSKKNIDLYRKYGKEKLANKLQLELEVKNYLTTLAFLDKTFTFCPVYFINTKDYGRVINGEESGFFLDENLKVDSTIVMKEKFFLFVERGPVYEQVGRNNSFVSSETSSTPIIQDALVIKDKATNQLVKPFPFYKKITFPGVLTSGLGYYMPNKKTGGTWHFAMPEDSYKDGLDEIVSRKTNVYSTEMIKKNSKNISFYFEEKYNLKNNEVVLPFNIYRLNVKLTKYYLKVIEE